MKAKTVGKIVLKVSGWCSLLWFGTYIGEKGAMIFMKELAPDIAEKYDRIVADIADDPEYEYVTRATAFVVHRFLQ